MGIIDNAAEMGFEGIEFSEGGWSNNLDPAVAEKIKERCAERGLEVVSYCVGANFLAADLDAEIERVKKQVRLRRPRWARRICATMSATASRDASIPSAMTTLCHISQRARSRSRSTAEQKGVGTMTENHGYFSQDAAAR